MFISTYRYCEILLPSRQESQLRTELLELMYKVHLQKIIDRSVIFLLVLETSRVTFQQYSDIHFWMDGSFL